MNKILEIISWIILGILASSFIWTIIHHQADMSHRNFEYIQCEQFWKLAIQTNKTDKPLFDCELIITEGVIKWNFKASSKSSFEATDNYYSQNYAYQKEVNELRKTAKTKADLSEVEE